MAIDASFDFGRGGPSGHVSADGNDSSQISDAVSYAIRILSTAGAIATLCFCAVKLKQAYD